MTSVPMRRRGPYEWAVMVFGCILGAMNVGLGTTLIAGDPRRTSGPAFNSIKDVAPIEVWGLAFVVSGLLALLCQGIQAFRAVALAHFLSGVMCLGWAYAFYSGLSNPNVSATGCWAYAALGLCHFTVGVTAWRTWRH